MIRCRPSFATISGTHRGPHPRHPRCRILRCPTVTQGPRGLGRTPTDPARKGIIRSGLTRPTWDLGSHDRCGHRRAWWAGRSSEPRGQISFTYAFRRRSCVWLFRAYLAYDKLGWFCGKVCVALQSSLRYGKRKRRSSVSGEGGENYRTVMV